MQLRIQTLIKAAIEKAIRELWKIEAPELVLNQTPKSSFGELATPISLSLAKLLKKPPLTIADELAANLRVEGITRTSIAKPGYINFHFDRAELFRRATKAVQTLQLSAFDAHDGKVIVEHTNINPNKAAHVGHLRNAVLGDTFVRILRFTGHTVEVQNYIDNTGVQLADVIVGFRYLENRSLREVQSLIQDPDQRFDFYCWDLYAKGSDFYEAKDPEHKKRAETLHAIEAGDNETAEMAELVSMEIVNRHLKTMKRVNIVYDVLPRESDILHLKFWDRAFELLKSNNAIFLEQEGKNKGCWVMRLEGDSGLEDKVIVRSDGTVTYVGKDIAYQLWKLGILEQDFNYEIFEKELNGDEVWVTTSATGRTEHPTFGNGQSVYNVIDVRQSYPQKVVKQGVQALGFKTEAENSVHLSYEMVALTAECAKQLGIKIQNENSLRSYVEISGRKGQGVKADDLLDILEREALSEVAKRNPDLNSDTQNEIACQIAVGALRYFMLRFTRNAVIAFDFKEALSFDGETGPYIQYAMVRANNIFKRINTIDPDFSMQDIYDTLQHPNLDKFLADDTIWELIYSASRLDEIASQVTLTMEPATMAKHSFTIAQNFSLFYHKYRIISEEDRDQQKFYLLVVDFVRKSLTKAMDLMGIEVPIRM